MPRSTSLLLFSTEQLSFQCHEHHRDVSPPNHRLTQVFFPCIVFSWGAQKVQRKGSFLSRSGSLHARSGSLASGRTTVSASKFVFMSSVPGPGAGVDDSCARTGFEEPAAREAGGGAAEGGGAGWSTSRPPFSASGANAAAAGGPRKTGGAGAFSGIGGVKKGSGAGGGGADKSRLWKGLCASGKQKSRR